MPRFEVAHRPPAAFTGNLDQAGYAPRVSDKEQEEQQRDTGAAKLGASDSAARDSAEKSSDGAKFSADQEAIEKAPPEVDSKKPLLRRAALPLLVFFISSLVYTSLLIGIRGQSAFAPSPDNHFVHLANSFLEGRLDHGANPPGTNDWACFDTHEADLCPNNRFRFGDLDRYKWYVSFPPAPAFVLMPGVALFGTDLPDRLFWALFAGLGPMALFVLLRRLSESGRSGRSTRENLLLTALFAFGSVFFFVAVQGTVWFAAQVFAVPLIAAYVFFALDGKHPLLAGAMLGLCFLTRPTTALLCVFFAAEGLKRHHSGALPSSELPWYRFFFAWLRGVNWPGAIRLGVLFSIPILICGAFAMWMNQARFGDPFEFGHTFLQIRWRGRIERWGLFNYHYMAKNLSVFFGGLPWLSLREPHIMISRHGLGLFVTTPAILLALWPKRLNTTLVGLFAAILPVAVLNLMYQNSGWAQFAYRFALDYLVLIFAALAISRRPFRVGFVLLFIWSIAINAFGAATFDAAGRFYNDDSTQEVLFQPD